MKPKLFEYFADDNHNCFLNDCSVRLIDKLDGSDLTRREGYSSKVFKTVAAYPSNIVNWWLHLHAFISFYGMVV